MNKTAKRRISKSAAMCAVLACLLIPAVDITASAQTAGTFSVRAVIPDNQVDTRQTYFDLRLDPGGKQTVQVVITNSQEKDLSVNMQLNNASTGRNGLIVYTEPDVRDDSLKAAVTDVAALREHEVTVPPLGSKAVDIDIQMPRESLDGTLLGGIVVTAKDAEEELQEGEGVTLKNTITYVIGLKITENDSEAEPDFDLAAITPSLINYRPAAVVTLRNKAPRIVKDMKVSAQVYRLGSDEVLRGLVLENSEMAPLSKGDFVIDWNENALEAGDYRLKMTAEYDGRIWEWDEAFTISSGAAGEVNEGAVGLEKNYMWFYFTVGFLALIIVAILAFLLGRRRKKDED